MSPAEEAHDCEGADERRPARRERLRVSESGDEGDEFKFTCCLSDCEPGESESRGARLARSSNCLLAGAEAQDGASQCPSGASLASQRGLLISTSPIRIRIGTSNQALDSAAGSRQQIPSINVARAAGSGRTSPLGVASSCSSVQLQPGFMSRANSCSWLLAKRLGGAMAPPSSDESGVCEATSAESGAEAGVRQAQASNRLDAGGGRGQKIRHSTTSGHLPTSGAGLQRFQRSHSRFSFWDSLAQSANLPPDQLAATDAAGAQAAGEHNFSGSHHFRLQAADFGLTAGGGSSRALSDSLHGDQLRLVKRSNHLTGAAALAAAAAAGAASSQQQQQQQQQIQPGAARKR